MIPLGGVVPLSVQLSDGNDSARVACRVLDPAGTLIFEVDLAHVSGGLYLNRQFLMPDFEFVTATYQIFGVTKEGGEYERGAETFFRDTALSGEEARSLFNEFIPPLDDFFTGKIVEETLDDFIEGTMSV